MPSTLLNSIVAHWRYEENGVNTRVDASGNNRYVDPVPGAISAVAGKINLAADLSGSYFERSGIAAGVFNPLTSFTIALWYKADAADFLNSIGLASFTEGGGADWYIVLDGGQAFFAVGNGQTGNIAIGDTDWHFYVAWFDSAAGTCNLQIDNGATVTSAPLTPTQIGAVLQLGNESGAWGVADGLLDSTSFWQRALTTNERTTLWNGGAGLDYPFDVSGGTPRQEYTTMSDFYTTKDSGEIYIQINGPNTKPEYLGKCVELDDFTEDKGGLSSLLQCFDGNGSWVTYGAIYSPPGAIDLKLTTKIGSKLSVLERLENCPFPLYINIGRCGKAGVFQKFDRNYAIDAQRITTEGFQGFASMKDDKEAKASFDIVAFPPVVKFLPLTVQRIAIAEVNALNDLAFRTDSSCAGPCGGAANAGDEGMVAGDFTALASANAYLTENGATFALGATDPFGVGEIVSSLLRLDIGGENPRYIAARGTTDAAAPAEIAYTDDLGATWTQVSVGSTNGQFAPGHESLFGFDGYAVWLTVTGGYIYKSEDAGATWAAKSSGSPTTEDLYSVKFYDADLGYASGENNALLITEDGGDAWTALTGPTAQNTVEINTIASVSDNRLWVGYDDGDLYYSEDKGETWSVRALPIAATSIRSMDWIDELHGLLAVNITGPVGKLLFTVDGGFTWVTLNTPTNAGLNSVQFINPRLAWAVGEVSGGTAVVLKAFLP